MNTDVQRFLGLLFFILPGYAGLYVHDLIVPAPARSTFRAIVWSLLLSSASVLVVTQVLPAVYLAHLYGPATLSTEALLGTGALALTSGLIGAAFALLKRFVLKGRLGRRSIHPTAWDALWSKHGAERPTQVVVEVPDGRYAGTLANADDPRLGHALILQAPEKWDEAGARYLPTGAKFSYFPADQIRRFDLSRASDPEKAARTNEQAQSLAEAGRDQVRPDGQLLLKESRGPL
jgi:hypothetical protein